MLPWRKTSPERSTPGPLPYQSAKTPSYLPSPCNSACWVPQTAVAARSSFRPGWKTILAAISALPARINCWSSPPSGEPR